MKQRSLKRYIRPVILLLAAGLTAGLGAGMMGCEVSTVITDPPTGGGNDTVAVQISVSPAETIIIEGDARQFFATVTGSIITDVTWSVLSGGGLVDSNGIYEAPYPIDVDTLPVVLKAVSVANPNFWTTASIKVIKTPKTGPGCGTTGVTYSGTGKPILQLNCYGCHSGDNPPRGLNLSQVSAVQTVAGNGKLYGAISHSPGFPEMPKGANKLDDCSIAKIKAWIDRGAPNN